MRRLSLSLCLVLGLACGGEPTRAVRIATTTSVENAGLLAFLVAGFERDTGIRVEPFVVGSGKAFAMARAGEVDVTITHEPGGERALLADGVALAQLRFVENRFLLVGPAENPAGIDPEGTVVEAMRAIHDRGARFVSRGDESGTHVRERELWSLAGRDPRENTSYQQLGQGMSSLLRSASELRAYTLTDEATYARMRGSVALVPIAIRGEALRNVYVVSLIAGPGGEEPAAGRRLFEWLASASGRAALERFLVEGGSGFSPARAVR